MDHKIYKFKVMSFFISAL